MPAQSLIVLTDHRRVSCTVYGSSERTRWVLYHHGFPGSRVEGRLWDEAGRKLGVSILAPDRPGFGSTDDAPGRTIAAWPKDVRQVCQALGIRGFGIIGVSGGGPYALACAAALPDLASSAQIVSSLAPPDAPGVFRGMALGNRAVFRLTAKAPPLGRAVTAALGRLWSASPALCLAWFRTFVSRSDRALLEKPEVSRLMLENIRTAFERGSQGAVHDFTLLANPWGFDLGAIVVPTTVWHGLDDSYVPAAMGEHIARAISGSTLKTFPESGHLLVFEHIEAILQAAAAADTAPRRGEPVETN